MTGTAWDSNPDDDNENGSEGDSEQILQLEKEWARAEPNPRFPGRNLECRFPDDKVRFYVEEPGYSESWIEVPEEIVEKRQGRKGVCVEEHQRRMFGVRCQECGFERLRPSEKEIANEAIEHYHKTGHPVKRCPADDIPGGNG